MDKKFAIQFIVLLIVIFAGLFSIFQPQLFGLPSIIPGGGSFGNMATNSATTTIAPLAVVKILFIAAESAGSPELVKSVLTADVAETPQQRAQGLSDRSSMGVDNGMIFVFEQESKYNFIMRKMQFPLDFIWVKGDTIVDVLENIPPDPAGTSDNDLKRYSPIVPVNRVIEVNGGYISKYGIKAGDRVKFEAAQ